MTFSQVLPDVEQGTAAWESIRIEEELSIDELEFIHQLGASPPRYHTGLINKPLCQYISRLPGRWVLDSIKRGRYGYSIVIEKSPANTLFYRG